MVPRSGTAFICIMPWLLIAIAYLQFLIIGNARAFTLSVREVQWLWASTFPTSRGTKGIRTHVSLFHAEIFLFRNTDCFFQGIEFHSEELAPDWTICETCMNNVNNVCSFGGFAVMQLVRWHMYWMYEWWVYNTFALFEFQEFKARPVLSSRRFECLPKQRLEDFQRPEDIWVV